MKSFFSRTSTRNIILGISTVAVSISISMMGNWSFEQEHYGPKLCFLIFSIIVNLVFLIVNTICSTNERRLLAELQLRIKGYENVIESIESLCENTSSAVTTIIQKANSDKVFDFEYWSFNLACKQVCTHIYNLIHEIKGASNFDVAYVRLYEDADEKDCVYMCAYASKMNKPSILGAHRKFREGNYYDLKLFARNSAEIVVLIDKEVSNNFYHSGIISATENKNKQYIALPVTCKDGKMIGLLEVTCHEESALGVTKKEVTEFANKYLTPFAHFILLLHKIEKAMIAGTENSINNAAY